MAFDILQVPALRPFNLVLNEREVILVPRTRERPAGFTNNFGGLEVAGCVVLTEEEPFMRLEYSEVRRAIAKCGLNPEAGRSLNDDLGQRLLGAAATADR